MPDTFHYFPLLPRELRDYIWELAVRPAVPGAHIFSTFHSRFNNEKPEGISSSFQAFHPCSPRPSLGAPRCLPTTVPFTRDLQASAPMSWLNNNPSTYLIDSGLWSACRESRQVIDKAFRRPQHHGNDASWNSSTADTDRSSNGLFALPAITSFATREGDVPRFLSVKPAQDLFILQPLDLPGRGLAWEIPFFTPSNLQIPRYREACYHIALEYDPSWDRGPDWEHYQHPLLSQLIPGIARKDISNFWFIDYRFKRSPDQTAGKEGAVFWASGRRYVQVWPQDPNWVLEGGGDMWDGSLAFAELLECDLERYEGDLAGDRWGHLRFWMYFGVLACEYF